MPTPRPSQSNGRLPGVPPAGGFTPDATPRMVAATPRDPFDDPSNVDASTPEGPGVDPEEAPFSSRNLNGGGKAGLPTRDDKQVYNQYQPMTPHGPAAQDRANSRHDRVDSRQSAQSDGFGGLPALQEDDDAELEPFTPAATGRPGTGRAPMGPMVEPMTPAGHRQDNPPANKGYSSDNPPQAHVSGNQSQSYKSGHESQSYPSGPQSQGYPAGHQEHAYPSGHQEQGYPSGTQIHDSSFEPNPDMQDNISERTEDEFAAPEEATPQDHKKPKKVDKKLAPMAACPEDDLLTQNPPPSSTGGVPSLWDKNSTLDPQVLWADDEFKAWMKTLNMGQRMRVQERMVIRAAVERSEQAVQALSSAGDKTDQEWLPMWQAAAQWSLGWFQETEFVPYIRHFGYEAENDTKWTAAPSDSGISVKLDLNGHMQMAGHTWYQVQCYVRRVGMAGKGDLEWPAPRRLVQLRLDLHDRLKVMLGADYARLFGETRFAKFGAPPGTTARLKAWLDKLASLINSGQATPGVAALTLAFFQAPAPEGVQQPSAAGLRQAGDSDSNLGGPSATPSLQGGEGQGGLALRGDFL